MKNLLLMLVVACQLIACNSKKKEQIIQTPQEVAKNDTTESVLGKVRVYEGLLPCADCEGIKTELKIYFGDGTIENNKFELSSVYQGKEPDNKFFEKGNYNTERGLGKDPDGTIYVLNYDKPEDDQVFYGYTADTPDKLFLLNDKREINKSKLNYFLTLKK